MKVSAVILLALSVVASAANAADATNLPSEAPAVAELGTPSPTIPDRAPGVDPSFGLPDADSIKPGEQAEEDFSDYKPDMPFVGNALMKRQSAAFRTQFAPLYARFGARFQVCPITTHACFLTFDRVGFLPRSSANRWDHVV